MLLQPEIYILLTKTQIIVTLYQQESKLFHMPMPQRYESNLPPLKLLSVMKYFTKAKIFCFEASTVFLSRFLSTELNSALLLLLYFTL